MTLWHKTLESRFSSFKPEQQILMVCNELNRAQNNLDDTREYKNCLERAMELIDFMIHKDMGINRLREILRARELLAQTYLSEPISTLSFQDTLIKLDSKAWGLVNGL